MAKESTIGAGVYQATDSSESESEMYGVKAVFLVTRPRCFPRTGVALTLEKVLRAKESME